MSKSLEVIVSLQWAAVRHLSSHNIYGQRDRLMLFRTNWRRFMGSDGDTVEVPSADHTRTFCYIDAVDMLVEMIFNPACANQTFNLGAQSEEIKIGDLASICAEVVGRTLTLKALMPTTRSPSALPRHVHGH